MTERSSGFLRHRPNGAKDGIDPATGEATTQMLSSLFGKWEPERYPIGLGEDEELAVLQSLHALAIEHYRDMLETLSRAGADTELDDHRKLEWAVGTIEPNLSRLARFAEGALERVSEAISQEEEEVAKAVRKVDPMDGALHADIRAHLRGLNGSTRAAEICRSIRRGDLQTLQAIASAPAYLSGLEAGGTTHPSYKAAQRILQEKLAPQHRRRAEALRAGKAAALHALSILDTKANRFLGLRARNSDRLRP